MLRPDRFPIEMSQEDLLALSTLCAYSWESEETIRTHGHESGADDIRESRDRIRQLLFRTGFWIRK